ncbi:MAG: hypothetical protein ACI8TF_002871 [Paracoccaceae bacterium]|jgi:hypothetical protein
MRDKALADHIAALGDDRKAFENLLDYIRPILRDGTEITQIDEIGNALEGVLPKTVPARMRPMLHLYRAIAKWRRDSLYERPFSDLNGARLQRWDLERYCQIRPYQEALVADAALEFPSAPGFRIAKRMHKFSPPAVAGRPEFVADAREDISVLRRAGATQTIIGFSGLSHLIAGIGWNMFDRAVTGPLNANLVVLRDFNFRLYLSGIKSIGNRAETLDHLRTLLVSFADTRISFIGGSGGVFGALHAAAELGVGHVVALSGPTSLALGIDSEDRQVYQKIAEDAAAGKIDAPDLVTTVNASQIARIDFFLAGQHAFDYAQMRNLADNSTRVVPHVYKKLSKHVIFDHLAKDGSILEAFRTAPGPLLENKYPPQQNDRKSGGLLRKFF